ncbi:MAG: NAD(P)-dependent oxidoreductase [Firmicutes bacterium]|nr:NAD(P)-dependent oxidoreductase [Bacillota bacterium]
MKVLITGAAGSVGRHLVRRYLEKGWNVRALDASPAVSDLRAGLPEDCAGLLDTVCARVEDEEYLGEAVAGMDAVVHLAWSFSDDPRTLLATDIKGHIDLLERMVASGVRRLVYTSSAVVYGAPLRVPIDETHPLKVDLARKPFYAAMKVAAENLNLAYAAHHRLEVTNIRFWWAYGDDIGGRHLREMAVAALRGNPLEVVAGAGGSFLHLDDLSRIVELAVTTESNRAGTFNVASGFVSWEDVATAIARAAGSNAGVHAVPEDQWRGSPFMMGRWELSEALAQEKLGYAPAFTPEEVRSSVMRAVGRMTSRVAALARAG